MALRLRPNDAPMAMAAVKSLVRLGYPEQAEEMAVGVVAQHPDNMHALRFYGEYLVATGRLDEAVRQFEKIIHLEPLQPAPHVMIATLLMATQREAEARAHLDKAIALGADPFRVWHELGAMLAEQGKKVDMVTCDLFIGIELAPRGELYLGRHTISCSIDFFDLTFELAIKFVIRYVTHIEHHRIVVIV